MKNKKRIKNVSIVVVIGVVLMSLAMVTIEPRENLTLVERGLRNIASPFQYGMSSVVSHVKGFFSSFGETEALQEENRALKQQIGLLNNQINLLEDAGAENIRLKEMLAYKTAESSQYDLMVAGIIAENNNNLQHTITLDKGSNDGVVSNMIVINHQGLVGRVTAVMAGSCEVVLVLDREGAVGARVWETRETPGVVEGMGAENNLLRMIHLPHDADICVGDSIVTSGLDKIYPAGIRIGEVIEIANEVDGLTKQAIIKPYVSFSKLEEVFILTQVQAGF